MRTKATEYYKSQQMNNQVSRQVLLKAVLLIKQWHDMPEENPDPLMFKIYYEKAPEMKMIRDTLGSYDEVKDEVIEATSMPVEVEQASSLDQHQLAMATGNKVARKKGNGQD